MPLSLVHKQGTPGISKLSCRSVVLFDKLYTTHPRNYDFYYEHKNLQVFTFRAIAILLVKSKFLVHRAKSF